jgi:hypothetical protein
MRGHGSKGSTTSLLIRYLNRPPDARFDKVLYADYLKDYVLYKWNPLTPLAPDEYLEKPIPNAIRNKVRVRRQGHRIGRLQTIPPTAGEVFYFRCMITHQPIRTFEDAKTVAGTVHSSFHAAAVEAGLFHNSNEGFYAMQEAVCCFYTPFQLRFLFSRIILEGYPATPLWTQFQTDLTQDYVHSTQSLQRGTDRALQSLADLLRDSSRSLSAYGLPEPNHLSGELMDELCRFEERRPQLQSTSQMMIDSLKPGQRRIFDSILDDVLRHETNPLFNPSPWFIEGKPGRGKTYLVDALAARLRGQGLIVLLVGTTALAATLYEAGRTGHNLFRIPVTEVSSFPSPLSLSH